MRRLKSGNTPNTKGNDQRAHRNQAAQQKRSEDQKQYKLNQEVATGEVWIDGRSIYRKVINVGTLPNAGTETHAIGSTYNEIVRLWGGFRIEDSFRPFPYVDTTTANLVELRVDGPNIVVVTAINYSGHAGFVVLEYTK